jgi:hypothetical protein
MWIRMTAFALVCAALGAGAAQVKVTPRVTDAVLGNPHMGWETFHRPANQDPALPEWIPSSVYYLRWGWRDLEPEPGKLNTALVDPGNAPSWPDDPRVFRPPARQPPAWRAVPMLRSRDVAPP